LQEIYVNDVLLFLAAIPKSTGDQPIGFSLQPFKGDPAFKRGAMEQEVLAKCGGTADKLFLDLI